MRLTISCDDGRVSVIDVDQHETVENVQALVEVEFGVLVAQQQLLHNGAPIAPGSAKLSDLGIREDDLLLVMKLAGGLGSAAAAGPAAGAGALAAATGGARGRGGRRRSGLLSGMPKAVTVDPALYTAMTWEDLPGGISPETLHAILQVNPGMRSEIDRRDPELAAAAAAATPSAIRTLMMKRNLAHAMPEAERAAKFAQLEARLAANPYDVDAQTQLEAMIAEKNVEENYHMAMEHMPEAFARVFMLYIPALINGTPVKVFVDSGAQSTILSQRCAERCGIMRLVDRHFAGTAVGVGTSKIVGRVHMAPLIIAGQHFPCTFVVIESGSIDCLFGLDMLRRYQACIDLHAGVLRLRLGGTSTDVPFLGESEIPKDEVGGDGFAGNDKDPAKDGAAGGSAAASGSSAPAAGAGAGAPASSTSSSMQVDKPAAAASSHVSPVPTTSSTAPAAGGASTAPAGGAGAPPAPGAAGGGGAAPLFGPIDLSSLMPPGGRGGRRGR